MNRSSKLSKIFIALTFMVGANNSAQADETFISSPSHPGSSGGTGYYTESQMKTYNAMHQYPYARGNSIKVDQDRPYTRSWPGLPNTSYMTPNPVAPFASYGQLSKKLSGVPVNKHSGLPPTTLDSFVRESKGAADAIYGDEGTNYIPPQNGYSARNTIGFGIDVSGLNNRGLTTGHGSLLPNASGTGWSFSGPFTPQTRQELLQERQQLREERAAQRAAEQQRLQEAPGNSNF